MELYGLAAFAGVFLLAVLWAVESIEAELTKHFELKVTAGDPAALRNDVESVLRRYHVKFELRSLGQKELVYDSELPLHTRTDRIANAILSLGKNGETEVAWDEKKRRSESLMTAVISATAARRRNPAHAARASLPGDRPSTRRDAQLIALD